MGAILVAFGEGDLTEAEQHKGDEPRKAERAVVREALAQQVTCGSEVFLGIGRDYSKVVQGGRDNEQVSGRPGQCQSLVQHGC
uniref:hypothetical protein n=1 Tax=Streptobacillus moniliformis TaxID=34105 RepID=UPI001E2970C1